jgi:hypothetical protein
MLIRLVPDEQVQAAHQAFYGARKDTAPPKVRNAQVFAALGEPRALKWRGHTYRVGPLSFVQGKRLFVALQALGESAPAHAARVIVRELRELTGTGGGTWHRATSDELAEALEPLLFLPIDRPTTPADTPKQVDILDGYVEYVRMWGAPASWDDYQIGLTYLPAIMARDALRAAEAARVAQADMDAWRGWTRAMRQAGYN